MQILFVNDMASLLIDHSKNKISMKQSIVVLFLQLVFGYLCSSTIFVYNLTNQLGEFQDYSTDIGPSIPMAGMKGRYVYLQTKDSCSPNLPPAPKNRTIPWFALIDLNYSCYNAQILNIQSGGYALAILSKAIDDEDDDDKIKQNLQLLPGDDNDHSKNGSISIPSTFISNKTKMHLITYSGMPNITMYVYPEYRDINRFMLILLGTLCLAIVVALLLFLLIYGCYRVYRIRKSIITKWRLKFLPTYVLQKGDLYEVCVICLDEYVEGAKLRILSCGHAFHCKCVDPWLVKSGCECPLCKRKADLGRGGNKRSTGGGDDDENGLSDERTALLGDEARDNYDDDDDGGGNDENPVRLIPEMQTTINAIVHPVDTPQRRNYGTIIGGHSSHNSAAPLVQLPDTNPPEQSTATFYIGSVIADDDIPVGDQNHHGVGGRVAPPQPTARLHGDSDEESEEDFYDVRNEYHV